MARMILGTHAPLAIGAAAALAVAGCSHDAPTPSTPQATAKPSASQKRFEGALPDIELEALDGHAKSLREVTKGKVAVVDLWATWCSSCREVSARAAELAKANNDPDLLVVGVAEGEEPDTISRFLGGAAPPYPIYVDHQLDLADQIGSEEIPTILLVDRDGKVRAVLKRLDAAALQKLGELLSEKHGVGVD